MKSNDKLIRKTKNKGMKPKIALENSAYPQQQVTIMSHYLRSVA